MEFRTQLGSSPKNLYFLAIRIPPRRQTNALSLALEGTVLPNSGGIEQTPLRSGYRISYFDGLNCRNSSERTIQGFIKNALKILLSVVYLYSREVSSPRRGYFEFLPFSHQSPNLVVFSNCNLARLKNLKFDQKMQKLYRLSLKPLLSLKFNISTDDGTQ